MDCLALEARLIGRVGAGRRVAPGSEFCRCGVGVDGSWVIGGRRPTGQGRAAAKRPASSRKRAASGQVDAKRMRALVVVVEPNDLLHPPRVATFSPKHLAVLDRCVH